MRRAIPTFFICLFLSPLGANADSPCAYCGNWVPTGMLYLKKGKRLDAITVTETSISLPLCASFAVERVYFTAHSNQFEPPPEATITPITAVLMTKKRPACKIHLSGLKNGASIKLELRPRGNEGWEELVLAIHPLSVIDDVIHGGEISENLAVRQGEKQRVRRQRSPTPIVEWWFVREGHNPCDEGTRRGESLCQELIANTAVQGTPRDKSAQRR